MLEGEDPRTVLFCTTLWSNTSLPSRYSVIPRPSGRLDLATLTLRVEPSQEREKKLIPCVVAVEIARRKQRK